MIGFNVLYATFIHFSRSYLKKSGSYCILISKLKWHKNTLLLIITENHHKNTDKPIASTPCLHHQQQDILHTVFASRYSAELPLVNFAARRDYPFSARQTTGLYSRFAFDSFPYPDIQM